MRIGQTRKYRATDDGVIMQGGKDKYIGFGGIFQKVLDKRANNRTLCFTFGRRKLSIKNINYLLSYRSEIFEALEIIHDA